VTAVAGQALEKSESSDSDSLSPEERVSPLLLAGEIA
jgi:hypothetical protein